MSNASGPQGFPAGIPILQETFQNWSQLLTVPNVWTCQPTSIDDIVRVCNWAASAGWRVRARGIMHGWSPLTVTEDGADGVVLIDMTGLKTISRVTPAAGSEPATITAQTGATMDALMNVLEYSPGGTDIGWGLPHVPAPGHITIGGALAIDAHGTAVPTAPIDELPSPYGSLSNQVLAFTAVVTTPGTNVYVARRFTRSDPDAKAFLVHCGRALLVDVTLQVVENYELQCQSIFDVPAATLFAAPAGETPPTESVGAYFEASGRVEVIWFPEFPSTGPTAPWLKVWTAAASQPSGSTVVRQPYNYGFSDTLPTWLTGLLKEIVTTTPSLTPTFTKAFATFSATAATLASVTDIWGPSKNTLLYVLDDTLRVTANGYAVLMRRADVQQAIADVTAQFTSQLAACDAQGQWPINAPLEIRVTALDDPSLLGGTSAAGAESPTISALSVDPTVVENGWDVAVWFDVLTVVPDGDPQGAYAFYEAFESWIFAHFADGFAVRPEWSKGWAYTSDGGPWTNAAVLGAMRQSFTTGRAETNNWNWQAKTLASYDTAGLFTNAFLDQLFVEVPLVVPGADQAGEVASR